MLSKVVAENIKKINLTERIQALPGVKFLQLVRDDIFFDDAFTATLQEQGVDIRSHAVGGYTDMIAEPHDTKVPISAIKYISQWLQQRTSEIKKTAPILIPGDQVLNINQGDASVEEQPFFFGNNNSLFGVLTRPANKNSKSSQCIILSNSGSVHHAGPNSIYTLIARELGALGYFVFRIDLENIGDSLIVDTSVENHPYQPNAVANIHSAIEFLKQQTSADKFILGGLCSGAHTVFHAGLKLTNLNVSKVLMINPLTFYWKSDMSLDTPTTMRVFHDQSYYKKSIYNVKKWKKLFTGKANISYISKFVFRRFIEFLQQIWRDNVTQVMGERTPLALDLLNIHNNGATITFIFASTDPGLDIVKSQAKRTLNKGIKENWIDIHVIDGADHTFSKKSSRDKLLSLLSKDFK
jgi:alpha/beta superfamily hydrolase